MKPQGTAGGRSAGAARTSEGTPRDPDALLERVLSAGNLADALRRVEQNKGAPGVDGVRAEDLRKHLETVGVATREELLAGTYGPKPVCAPPPNGVFGPVPRSHCIVMHALAGAQRPTERLSDRSL